MRFVNEGDLIVHEIPKHSKQIIPCNIVEEIYWNLESGKDFTQAHTHFKISKEQADFILMNYYPIGKRPEINT